MIDFVGKRKIFYTISLIIIAIGIVSFATKGFVTDIEFSGGSVIEVDLGATYENSDIEEIVKEVTGETPRVQKMGNESGKQTSVSIGTSHLEEEKKNEIMSKLAEKYGVEDIHETATFRNVSAAFGTEMKRRAVLAVVIAAVCIMAYIGIMFKVMSGFTAGFTAVCALFHDLFVMFIVYSLTGIPLNTTFVAALLTILGYSVNDTVVVYDRIRENKLANRKMSNEEVVNLSINQSIRRTVFTSITILIALVLMYSFGVYYKVSTIKDFILPLIAGVVSGTYSSLLLSGSLWISLNNFLKNMKKAK
ncbi:MAG: protein translocase subunit SecF [Clostridia bacterium]|nr:protein translocase subunit SecF [Clostridia bacterium]